MMIDTYFNMEDKNCLFITNVTSGFCEEENSYNGLIYLECNYDPDIGIFCEGELLFTTDEILQFHEEKELYYEEHENCKCTEMHPYDKFLYNSPGGAKWYKIHCESDPDSNSAKYLTERGGKFLIKEGGFTLRKNGKECAYCGFHIVEIGIRKELYIKKAK